MAVQPVTPPPARRTAFPAPAAGAWRLGGHGVHGRAAVRSLWHRVRGTGLAASAWASGLWDQARRENIPRLLLIMLLLHLLVSAVVYLVERSTFVPKAEGDALLIDSLQNAFWWAIVTMTTTGYGDLFPKTGGGRLVASALMVGGSLTLSMFTASFASMLVARRLEAAQGLTQLKVRNHVILVGWNRRAEQIIAALATASLRRPQIVLINQLPIEQLTEIGFKHRAINLLTIRGDATHVAVLDRANLKEASAVIVLSDTTATDSSRADDRVLFVALAVRDANAGVKIAAELLDTEKVTAVRHAGVDEVIVAGEDTAFFLASAAVAPGVARAARQLLTYGSGREMRRVELARELRGRTFREARAYYRALDGSLLVGIISEGGVLTIGDVLSSSTDWVDEFIRAAFRQSGNDVVDQDHDRTHAIIPAPDSYVVGNKDSGILIGGGRR